METKVFSSSGFSHECSAEELYVLTRHWLSDIKFFEQEILFFQTLIRNYILPGVDNQVTRIDLIANQFKELEGRKELLKEDVISHQHKLAAVLDTNHMDEQSFFNAVQSKLEGEFFDFIKAFRYIKQELFNFMQTKHNTALMQSA